MVWPSGSATWCSQAVRRRGVAERYGYVVIFDRVSVTGHVFFTFGNILALK